MSLGHSGQPAGTLMDLEECNLAQGDCGILDRLQHSHLIQSARLEMLITARQYRVWESAGYYARHNTTPEAAPLDNPSMRTRD